MDTILDFLLTFFVLGGMAFLVAQMSKEREIGFWTLFAISVFFTPFIGIIVGLLSKKKRNPNAPPEQVDVKETQDKFWDRFMPKKETDNVTPPAPFPSTHPEGKVKRKKRNKDKGTSNRRVNL